MERRNDMPPAQTIRPMEAPPDSSTPTTAQLKADIDSGGTGDKIGVFDPAMSPLGTDDEAAGTPPEPHRIRMARRLEGMQRWSKAAHRALLSRRGGDPVLVAYIGGIVAIGSVMVLGMIWGRSW